MAGIIPFDFETNAVRVVQIDGETWFSAPDVCRVLQHSNPTRLLSKLDEDEKRIIDPNETLGSNGRGGAQMMNVITRGAAIFLTVNSKLPVARRFRRWLTDEVIPALMRDGTYSLTDSQQLSEKRAYYEGLPEGAKSRALLRKEAVERVNALIASGVKIGVALKEVAADQGCSPHTVRRWRNETYMVADPDIPAALAPKWNGERGMQVECDPDALRRYLELCARGLRFAAAYQRVLDEAGPNGWGPIPCAKTMRRAAGRALPRHEQNKKIL